MDELIRKLQTGEISSKEEISRALKLLMNKSGSDLSELKEQILSDIEYSTDTIEHAGRKYISVDAVKDILKD